MATTQRVLGLDHAFARELPELHRPWRAEPVPEPHLLLLNDGLAVELGLDPGSLRTPAGVAALTGGDVGEDGLAVAQAYAGHQFGGFSPRLGDGRALLLGEVVDPGGGRRDVHLKGSGRTPFSRGGDGKAALGPVLREYLMGEAMHALGIPTTRALAALTTGELVHRERSLPGAILVRVAASHLRVGTFQYAALTGDRALMDRLVTHAAARHHPRALDADRPALALLEGVADAQAQLVAGWMLVGFVHGVMNTDNTTISGETIDYGPCAFMDRYDPRTVFSSIDHGGRYAYGNQPAIVRWNLARLAEALLPLIDDDEDRAVELATAVLDGFAERYRRAHSRGLAAKLGLRGPGGDADPVLEELPDLLVAGRVDLTSFFRELATALRGDEGPLRRLFDAAAQPRLADWLPAWRRAVTGSWGARRPDEAADAMDAANPRYIPRNHLVEEALDAAVDDGDLAPLTTLLGVLADPFTDRPGLGRYADPAPEDVGPYRTFCGT